MNATLTSPAPLAAPAWGTAGCGADDLHDLLASGFAAWGCRGIWVAPNWRARKGSRESRPALDLLGNRQDCTVADEARRGSLGPILDAAVNALRERIAACDYNPREDRLSVEPVLAGGYRADLRVRVAGGYVYALVAFRDLDAAEAAEAAEAERVKAEAERVKAEAKREAARAKRAAKRLDAIVRERTAFDSFDALVDTHPDYWPTIKAAEHPDLMILADAFDAAVEAIGQSRRAWRGC